MTITASMNLSELADRMGVDIYNHTELAITMRDLLVEEFDGQDTAEISENDWDRLLNQV